MRKIVSISLATAALLITSLPLGTNSAGAYSNSRMIDNQVFDNAGTMNESAIQSFLNSKNSTCLKNYSDVDFNWNGSSWVYGPGTIPASRIIYKAAQQWGINPQVLIATLQKEESLITGASCDGWRYNSAMGYGCPDGGGCNPKYVGFSKQVLWGAWQLKFNRMRAEGHTSWDGDDAVTYGGFMTQGNRARCGSCTVNFYSGYATIDGQSTYLENGATASLYTYTPHLNQSFPGIFEGWFGSTFWTGGITNIDWAFENLDGGDSSAVSGYASPSGQTPLTIVYNSVLHVFAYDYSTGNLRHAYADNGGWHFEFLDGAGGAGGRINGDVGIGTTAVVYNSALHIFYFDQGNGDLRHAIYNGSSWSFETLDGAGGASGRLNATLGYHPTVTAFGTGLQLFYYDASGTNLRHAWINTSGDSWHFEDLDGTGGGVSQTEGSLGSNSTSVAFGTTVQVFYYDNTYGNVRHGWSNDTGWHFENLDGDVGSVGHSNADLGINTAAAAYGTTLQVFYYDRSHGNLRHGWSDSGGWHFENIDGDAGSVGHNDSNLGAVPSLAIYQNILYTFYYDAGSGDLRHAYSDSAGWHFGVVDGNVYSESQRVSDVGINSTAVEYGGNLQLYYFDSAHGYLYHAWGPLK
jgi:hypothetical protein